MLYSPISQVSRGNDDSSSNLSKPVSLLKTYKTKNRVVFLAFGIFAVLTIATTPSFLQYNACLELPVTIKSANLDNPSQLKEELTDPQQLKQLKVLLGCDRTSDLTACIEVAEKLVEGASSSTRKQERRKRRKMEKERTRSESQSLPVETRKDLSLRMAKPNTRASNRNSPQLFHCGYPRGELFRHIFPEHSKLLDSAIVLDRNNARQSKKDDILIVGVGGFCDGWRNRKLLAEWMEENFKGKVIWFNGENFLPLASNETKALPPRQYQVGYPKDDCQNVRVHYMTQFLLEYSKDISTDTIFIPERRPVNDGKNFLLYTASNCVGYREEAFDRLALLNISNVDYGGKCQGKMQNHTNVRPRKIRRHYALNHEYMKHFRYCLVMENTKLDGYITEKILLAYRGGCIPIYYGTREIFNIFNPKSFIYYDIEDPQPALNEIIRLEGDRNAYEQVLKEPILLDGSNTIAKYFSLSDEIIPNAPLKKKIRDMVQGKNRKCIKHTGFTA
jgi:hypothetical protein